MKAASDSAKRLTPLQESDAIVQYTHATYVREAATAMEQLKNTTNNSAMPKDCVALLSTTLYQDAVAATLAGDALPPSFDTHLTC